jgi:NAD-dependent dihydropyrimidine dehydrogenase PreA subunit
VKEVVIRKIVQIDEKLCNGCGECIPNCAEGALQIIEGSARLVRDDYCDGLGACLGHCPQGAIRIIEREAESFNEEAVLDRVANHQTLKYEAAPKDAQALNEGGPDPLERKAALRHWPIQLNLVPLKASFFEDRDLLVIADCVPLAYSKLHESLLPEKAVVMGCPKFDDAQGYAQKLSEIVRRNNVKRITIAHMEVPCCSGLDWVVRRAVENSGKQIPIERRIITIKGEMR